MISDPQLKSGTEVRPGHCPHADRTTVNLVMPGQTHAPLRIENETVDFRCGRGFWRRFLVRRIRRRFLIGRLRDLYVPCRAAIAREAAAAQYRAHRCREYQFAATPGWLPIEPANEGSAIEPDRDKFLEPERVVAESQHGLLLFFTPRRGKIE
ncbi:hypothetical protein [Bradyrhizobium sp.]